MFMDIYRFINRWGYTRKLKMSFMHGVNWLRLSVTL